MAGEDRTRSDRTGRFLLVVKPAAAARRVLQIDGRTASRPIGATASSEYGLT